MPLRPSAAIAKESEQRCGIVGALDQTVERTMLCRVGSRQPKRRHRDLEKRAKVVLHPWMRIR
eukprot:706540-Amphidinium_carterae.1